MITKGLRAKKVDLEKDLRINNFFSEKKHQFSPYLFVLGLALLTVIALEAGIVTMMAAK